jgi:5'-3' exonuclease
LNEEVCKALLVIWEAAKRPSLVYIAVDGVVPMAKIKQQRMRRFKSVWWAAKEVEMGVRKRGEDRWDTNAITPGTAYMEGLAAALQDLCKRRGWIVSTADEPGEGEHKAMSWLRTHGGALQGTVVVYGLDADLIVLAMLNGREHLKHPCVLMRERTEFGKQAASCGTAPFLFFKVSLLLESLCPVPEEQPGFLLDYVAVMCLLGNDFLPHGLTLTIREGGHDRLVSLLRKLRARGSFVDYATKAVQYVRFHELFCELALTEETLICEAIQKKRSMRPMAPRNEVERLMLPIQGLPAAWFVEKEFLVGEQLRRDWKEVYAHHAPAESVREYVFGIQWVVDYYVGRPVDVSWFYPWHLPPLWSQLATSSQRVPLWSLVPLFGATSSSVQQAPLKPQEQLALVLPIESWHLIRDTKLRNIPRQLPQFWPQRFGFMSLGKAWMWECEADIPILSPGRMRIELVS